MATAWNELLLWLQNHPLIAVPLAIGILLFVAWLSLLVVRATVLPAISALAGRTPNRWDVIVLKHNTLGRLAYLVPVAVIFQGAELMQSVPEAATILLQRLALASSALVIVRSLSALLAALNEVYNLNPRAAARPIKGILQVINVVAHIGATIFIVAALLDRSPLILLSGLGAMSAIVMLVFRDSILSLVAGVQITRGDLIRIGDWIEMPQFNADGFVIDIALNSVRVQNWDKTITAIPAHKFLENSFKNWRGMQESGGRRIMRSVLIDLSTVRFLTAEEVDRFERFELLRDYIQEKKRALEEHRKTHPTDATIPVNVRRLTNIGTLRAYIERYIKQHPGMNQDMLMLVRQLQPTEKGLPLQIYAFTSDVAWVAHEGVQADIFDHILAAIPQFGLRLFQEPSGNDFARALMGPENLRAGDLPPSIAPEREKTRIEP